VIPVIFEGQAGGYVHSMYLNNEAPIAGGREIWGFPKKLAAPSLTVETDTLLGTLDYGSVRVATATMGYKHHVLDKSAVPAACSRRTTCSRSFPMSTAAPASASSFATSSRT
jgi:acetoacetate decarboxylase